MDNLLLFEIVGIVISLLAFAVAVYFILWIRKLPKGTADMENIGLMIKKGARAFLRREYKTLAWFVLAAAVLIFVFLPAPIWGENANIVNNISMTIAYIAGSVFSALAGKIGIEVATIANVKTAVAAKTGIRKAFLSGFRGGAVMGMAVVGAALVGASLLFMITGSESAVLGFSFGASTLALFAKAGGGIFTKTADISADLVGKVELGLEEDDPRNPAVIADNVGDNVGDVAGMGADLFDSNVASIVAAMIIGSTLVNPATGVKGMVDMVLCYAAMGLLASIFGVLLSRMGKKSDDPGRALNKGTYITTALFAILTAGASFLFGYDFRIWGATFVGLLVGVIVGLATDYFTNDAKKPVQHVAKASQSGPAFTILSGISYGFMSALPSLIGIGVSAAAAYYLCAPIGPGFEMFGISMAALGMLSIVGMIVSNDAYGPIVDNSRGLAEMGGLGEDVIKITDELDSAGNTVKAITKGFAIGAAGLTVIALLAAFIEGTRLSGQRATV
jgi:K(+)-stimulated pyrophosphate-energized sodium pump